MSKAKRVSRESTLQSRNDSSGHKIPLVLTYNNYNRQVLSVVKRNFKYLSENADIGNLFEDNLLGAFRNDKSLSNTLVKSKLNCENEIPGSFACHRSRCNTCEHISSTTIIQGPFGNFEITRSFSCVSKGVVYCIFCTKCNAIYVGETGRRLADRTREHLNDISHNRYNKSDVARHFNLSNHSLHDFNVCGLVYCNNTSDRKSIESNIIKKLGTFIPLGLNQQE
jgi:hypothetical protein